VAQEIDASLKAVGFSSGSDADDYRIIRQRDERGGDTLVVLARGDDRSYTTIVPFSRLKQAATARITKRRNRLKAPAVVVPELLETTPF
jgi:hypothetical protein